MISVSGGVVSCSCLVRPCNANDKSDTNSRGVLPGRCSLCVQARDVFPLVQLMSFHARVGVVALRR